MLAESINLNLVSPSGTILAFTFCIFAIYCRYPMVIIRKNATCCFIKKWFYELLDWFHSGSVLDFVTGNYVMYYWSIMSYWSISLFRSESKTRDYHSKFIGQSARIHNHVANACVFL